jgi:hypothetical protein
MKAVHLSCEHRLQDIELNIFLVKVVKVFLNKYPYLIAVELDGPAVKRSAGGALRRAIMEVKLTLVIG